MRVIIGKREIFKTGLKNTDRLIFHLDMVSADNKATNNEVKSAIAVWLQHAGDQLRVKEKHTMKTQQFGVQQYSFNLIFFFMSTELCLMYKLYI